jgi:hypothetical protein
LLVAQQEISATRKGLAGMMTRSITSVLVQVCRQSR